MKKFDYSQVPRLIDVSTVQTICGIAENDLLIDVVRKYSCVCASPMPAYTKYVIDRLADRDDIVTTGVVSFPSGAEDRFIKEATTKDQITLGCEEIDMVTNVGFMKSKMYNEYRDDIKAVVEAANGVPVKAIIEQCYLEDDEICKASELCVEAGVTFVKTGTGWGPKPTTVHTIELIKKTIGESALIKAAGGVRTLETLVSMVEVGCNRFGIGYRTAPALLEEAAKKAAEQNGKI